MGDLTVCGFSMCPAGLFFGANIYALDLLPLFSAIVRNSHRRRMNLPSQPPVQLLSEQTPWQGCRTQYKYTLITPAVCKTHRQLSARREQD